MAEEERDVNLGDIVSATSTYLKLIAESSNVSFDKLIMAIKTNNNWHDSINTDDGVIEFDRLMEKYNIAVSNDVSLIEEFVDLANLKYPR